MKNILVIMIAALTLLGCVTPQDRIDISYAPRPNIPMIPGANRINVSVEITDSRLQKFRLTSKRYSIVDTSHVFARNDVVSALRWGIESELKNLGFSVDGRPAVYIIADLVRFDSEYQYGTVNGQAIADMHFHVKVLDQYKRHVYATTISTQSVGDELILSGQKMTRLALNQSLETAMDKLFMNKRFVEAMLISQQQQQQQMQPQGQSLGRQETTGDAIILVQPLPPAQAPSPAQSPAPAQTPQTPQMQQPAPQRKGPPPSVQKRPAQRVAVQPPVPPVPPQALQAGAQQPPQAGQQQQRPAQGQPGSRVQVQVQQPGN